MFEKLLKSVLKQLFFFAFRKFNENQTRKWNENLEREKIYSKRILMTLWELW